MRSFLVVCLIMASTPYPALVFVSGVIAMAASGRVACRFILSKTQIGKDFAWMTFGEFVSFGFTTLFSCLALLQTLDGVPTIFQSFMRNCMFAVGFYTTDRFYRAHFHKISNDKIEKE